MVDPNGSQRAWDLYVKSRYVDMKNPGRALVLASGTPITNTLGEMFSLQRFMAPAMLEERGVHAFYAWAASFGLYPNRARAATIGPLQAGDPLRRVRQRARARGHVPQLRRRGAEGGAAQLCDLPIIRGGGRRIVTTAPGPGFKAYQRQLEVRIKAIEGRKGAPEGEDILLSVITDGRHAAIDLRLVDPVPATSPAAS